MDQRLVNSLEYLVWFIVSILKSAAAACERLHSKDLVEAIPPAHPRGESLMDLRLTQVLRCRSQQQGASGDRVQGFSDREAVAGGAPYCVGGASTRENHLQGAVRLRGWEQHALLQSCHNECSDFGGPTGKGNFTFPLLNLTGL